MAFSFREVGIGVGAELQSTLNSEEKAIVCSDHQIKFRGKVTSLSRAAIELKRELGFKPVSLRGPIFWTFGGKLLSSLPKLEEIK